VSILYQLSKEALDDGDRWWGDVQGTSLVHHALAQCGEVGELVEAMLWLTVASGKTANLAKKIERGSLSLEDPNTIAKMKDEADDVFTYLLNIAGILDHDMLEGYYRKRAINDERFMIARAEREREEARVLEETRRNARAYREERERFGELLTPDPGIVTDTAREY